MATSSSTPEEGAIELYQSAPLPNHRPIAARTLEIAHTSTLPGNRPVTAVHLDIVDTDSFAEPSPDCAYGS
ncbi:MAG: hypothetical protein HC934_11290 [Acaryochloridaceae cyanobacterium SU_2_1]|nr:hypothetical protein [Acaryochloridaceae cyanobacterium SU_2_1]